MAARGLLERAFRELEYIAPSSKLRSFPPHNLHHLPLPATDALSLAAGQIYHLQPSDQYIELHGVLVSCPDTMLICY